MICKTELLKNEGKGNKYITAIKHTQKMKTICSFHSQKKKAARTGRRYLKREVTGKYTLIIFRGQNEDRS